MFDPQRWLLKTALPEVYRIPSEHLVASASKSVEITRCIEASRLPDAAGML